MPQKDQQPIIPDDEEKKTSEVRDITDEGEKDLEELDSHKEETQEKVESTEDEEIGVQEVQDGVKKATSTHVTEDEISEGLDLTSDVDSFANKVDSVLQDAGLTKKHVYFCCGGVFVLVVLAFTVFFGVKFFIGFLNGDNGVIPDDNGSVPEVIDPVDDGEVPEGQVWVDPSLYSGILVGTDEGLQGQSGVQEGVEVGETETVSDELFSYQLEHYGKVMNALSFDVNEYLNDFEDRSVAVDGLIVELQDLYDEGIEILEDLQDETSELEVIFDGNSEEKDFYEAEFFSEFEDYDGDDAVSALNNFIEIGQEQVDIKAQYKARGKLYEVLYNALLYLNARIDDITLNKEALVKGVQVVDVRGSDLELIFEEGLE